MRPRDQGPEYAQLQRTLNNTQHKLQDTRLDYERLRESNQASLRKIRRLSDSHASTLQQQQDEFDKQLSFEKARIKEQDAQFQEHLLCERAAFEKEVSKLQDGFRVQQDGFDKETARLTQLMQQEMNLQEAAEQEAIRINRHVAYVKKLKAEIRSARRSAHDVQAQQVELQEEIAEVKATCTGREHTSQAIRRARIAKDPRKASKSRSLEFSAFIPKHWSVDAVQWVLAQLAVEHKINASDLADSVLALSTLKFKHRKATNLTVMVHQFDPLS